MSEIRSRDRGTQAKPARSARMLRSYRLRISRLGRLWRRWFPAREFFAELQIPGDVRDTILQSATLFPISTPECKTGRIGAIAAIRFLSDYLPETAADIARGTRLAPEELLFSTWYEPGPTPAEGRTNVSVATLEASRYLPIPIRWRRCFCPGFPCRNSTTSNSGKTIG